MIRRVVAAVRLAVGVLLAGGARVAQALARVAEHRHHDYPLHARVPALRPRIAAALATALRAGSLAAYVARTFGVVRAERADRAVVSPAAQPRRAAGKYIDAAELARRAVAVDVAL